MNVRVAYYSATGNTRKVAETIARALGCTATGIDEYPTGPADLLFLGAAVYATHDHGLHAAVKAFIAGLDPTMVKRVALFSTGFIQSEAIAMMRSRLEARGITVVPESFFSLGRFALFNMGHPNAKELESAAEIREKGRRGLAGTVSRAAARPAQASCQAIGAWWHNSKYYPIPVGLFPCATRDESG